MTDFNDKLLKLFKLEKQILTQWLSELNAKIDYLEGKTK